MDQLVQSALSLRQPTQDELRKLDHLPRRLRAQVREREELAGLEGLALPAVPLEEQIGRAHV